MRPRCVARHLCAGQHSGGHSGLHTANNMAKVQAPFLSIHATGNLSPNLAARKWKGLSIVESKPHPSTPATAAQSEQRARITTATKFWRTWVTNQATREAWDWQARIEHQPRAGYHLAMSSLLNILTNETPPLFVVDQLMPDTNTPNVLVRNPLTDVLPDYTWGASFWIGDDPTHLTQFETPYVTTGAISGLPIGTAGQVKYVRVKYKGYWMTGLYKLTLADPPACDYYVTGYAVPDCRGAYDYAGTYWGQPYYVESTSTYSLWRPGVGIPWLIMGSVPPTWPPVGPLWGTLTMGSPLQQYRANIAPAQYGPRVQVP